MNTILLKNYEAPPIRFNEILRYAGVRGEAPELMPILETCLGELQGKLTCRVCFREFPVSVGDAVTDLGFTETDSVYVKKRLTGCEGIILFAATVGIEIDRLIGRYGHIAPTKALLLQAIGAERIESLCQLFETDITQEKATVGLQARSRFSPGYGDIPLEMQRDIVRVLDCSKKIGLTLNESLLMSPSKSVTAIIGLSRAKACKESACDACGNQECEYRRLK